MDRHLNRFKKRKRKAIVSYTCYNREDNEQIIGFREIFYYKKYFKLNSIINFLKKEENSKIAITSINTGGFI